MVNTTHKRHLNVSRRIQRSVPRGQNRRTKYRYDKLGNLTNVLYAASPALSYRYDALNRLTNMVDASGASTFTWHLNGRLMTEDGPWANDTVTYGYNNARLRSSLSLQQPATTNLWTNGFLYDAARRLTRVTSPAGAYTNTYRGAGTLVTNLALPNGSRITNAFDNVGRLTQTRLRTSGGTTLNTHSYLYNLGHQRYRHTRSDGSYVTLTYDNIGQLKTAIGTGNQSTENLGYTYDAAWNLTTRTNYGTPQTFAVNVKNELTSAVGLNCTYDANGNLVSRVYDSNGPKIYYYVYDDENQLIEMRTDTYYTSAANRFKTEWLYDGLGRVRVRTDYNWYEPYGVWSMVENVRYIYDGRRVIQERNSGNTPTVSYTRGSDLSGSLEGAGGIGGLLGRSHGYSSGNWSTHNHYHADGGGNITYLVNSSQGLAASYRYDPYGRVIGWSGSLTNANVYRFSSKEVHVKSGMYGYGFRFYDSHLQRWLNRDPIFEAGGINLYGFVLNRPLNGIDPWGLDEFDDICGDFLRERRKNMQEGAELFHTVKNEVGKELAMSAVPVGRLARLGGAGKRSIANAAARAGWPRHHVIPKAILDDLPADVRKAVQGRRGDPNRWPIPKELHDKIHDHNRGFPGGPYNKFFDDKLKPFREKRIEPTVEDVLKWKEEAIDRFGLSPYCPL